MFSFFSRASNEISSSQIKTSFEVITEFSLLISYINKLKEKESEFQKAIVLLKKRREAGEKIASTLEEQKLIVISSCLAVINEQISIFNTCPAPSGTKKNLQEQLDLIQTIESHIATLINEHFTLLQTPRSAGKHIIYRSTDISLAVAFTMSPKLVALGILGLSYAINCAAQTQLVPDSFLYMKYAYEECVKNSKLLKEKIALHPYQILNIPPNASLHDIKESFKILAKKYHPDKNIDKNHEEKESLKIKFNELYQAYRELENQYNKNKRSDVSDTHIDSVGNHAHRYLAIAYK